MSFGNALLIALCTAGALTNWTIFFTGGDREHASLALAIFYSLFLAAAWRIR